MSVFKRFKKKKIRDSTYSNWDKATWYMEFSVDGKRVHQAIPMAKTKKDALLAESKVRAEINAGLFYRISTETNFKDFFETVFLPWSRENKCSWKHDEFRGKYLVEYFGKTKLSQIQPAQIERYKESRSKLKSVRGTIFAPSTINRDLQLLSKIMSMAYDNALIPVNPVSRVRKFREGAGRERFFTRDEETRLLAITEAEYPYLTSIIIIAVYTGLRKNELLKLKFEHFNLTNETTSFFHNGRNFSIPPGCFAALDRKSGKSDVLPINQAVRNEILKLRGISKDAEYVFTNKHTGVPYTEIKKGFRSACEAAGIPYGQNVPNGVTFHDLRHTFATRLREAGVHEFDIAELMGHSSIKMTRRYAHGQTHTMQRAVELITNSGGYGSTAADNHHEANAAEVRSVSDRTETPPPFHHLAKNGLKSKTATKG